MTRSIRIHGIILQATRPTSLALPHESPRLTPRSRAALGSELRSGTTPACPARRRGIGPGVDVIVGIYGRSESEVRERALALPLPLRVRVLARAHPSASASTSAAPLCWWASTIHSHLSTPREISVRISALAAS